MQWGLEAHMGLGVGIGVVGMGRGLWGRYWDWGCNEGLKGRGLELGEGVGFGGAVGVEVGVGQWGLGVQWELGRCNGGYGGVQWGLRPMWG